MEITNGKQQTERIRKYHMLLTFLSKQKENQKKKPQS